jgi:predicted 2-oxoglutarate/Fe(II)-dependent dioxygenase YbiX
MAMPEYQWINEDICTVTEFFTPDECDAYIQFAEVMGFTDAPITTALGPIMRKDVRNNTRVMIDDTERAEQLWQRSIDYVPDYMANWWAVGINERLRLYRYDVGQQFDWHSDGAFRRSISERSRLTFMVYLNDDFEGGHTAFEDYSDVVPKKGMALFFTHEICHKGQPVTKGRKYVLRSDVMYRRKDG